MNQGQGQQIKRPRLDEATEAQTKPLSDVSQRSSQRYEKSMASGGGVSVGMPERNSSGPVGTQPGQDMHGISGAAVAPEIAAPATPGKSKVQACAPPQNDESVKALSDFLVMMDNYAPIIPNSVTRYYLRRSGFDCPDDRVIKVISLAAQKFVADIANDAMQFCKIRQEKRGARDAKYVLTMEDLSSALAEQGVEASKPSYFAGSG